MAKATKKGAKRTSRATKGRSSPIDALVDAHVGSRVRQRRILLGMNQEMLGKAVGITFQQIQKYEKGKNRIGASRLFTLSKVLSVPISFFYEDMPRALAAAGGKARRFSDPLVDFEADPMPSLETAKLVRAYYRVESPARRRKVLELLRSMSN